MKTSSKAAGFVNDEPKTTVTGPEEVREPIAIVDGIKIYSLDQVFEPNDERAFGFMIREIVKSHARIANLEGYPPRAPSSPLHSTVNALSAEIERQRFNVLVDSVDTWKARAAFPARFRNDNVRRKCRDAYAARQRGEPHDFVCWPVGAKGIWYCSKSSVDQFLVGQGVAPVNLFKITMAQLKRS
ncbi:hypothetical protein [Bradyrhizobium sp. LB11.1]|uniref:hypothetical protein n=1 Tax=Bradyrhizobium sp. LB11.1 TaxID=3156326 RepID=UPI0033985327